MSKCCKGGGPCSCTGKAKDDKSSMDHSTSTTSLSGSASSTDRENTEGDGLRQRGVKRVVYTDSDHTKDVQCYDTVIIGMGAAGCTAAAELCKAGRSVLGIEADSQVGGRVATVPLGDGVVELGAEWIHGETPSKLYEIASVNNKEIVAQNISFLVYRSDGTMADEKIMNELINFTLNCVDDPPDEPEPLGEYLTQRIISVVEDQFPELDDDPDFLEQFLSFMDLVIDNYESSNSWNDVTTHSRYEDLVGNLHLSWGSQGYCTLFEMLLDNKKEGSGLENLELKVDTVVKTISYPKNPEGKVEVICEDGSVYRAQNAIVTVSLGVLKEHYTTLFRPPLPDEKSAVIDAISFGVVDKIVLLFPCKWWPEGMSFFGFLWKEKDQYCMSREDEWVTKIFGASVPMGTQKVLTLWTSGRTAKVVETLPNDVVKNKIMFLLRKFMGKNRAIPEPLEMLRSNWFLNPYTRGSYTYDNLLTPQNPLARRILAEPLVDASGTPRLLFAGEATHDLYFSTVHGAMDTGYREAKRLLGLKLIQCKL